MLNPLSHSELVADARVLCGRIEDRLARLVPEDHVPPAKLHRAIRYSLLAPGKRVRPILMLHAARSFGGDEEWALDPACALEMVHAASLIVDDFPFMDDAVERRGLPASHREFGLETATLAAFALLNRAFGVLADAPFLPDEVRTLLVQRLSSALGDCGGIIAGQEEDLEAPATIDPTLQRLERMVGHKTAALFVAAVEAGALIAGARSEELAAAREFAWKFGLCFQALDDLDDRPSPTRARDDEAGRDGHEKLTFVSVLGVDGAWRAAEAYAAGAVEALETIGLGDTTLAAATSNLLGIHRPRRALPSL